MIELIAVGYAMLQSVIKVIDDYCDSNDLFYDEPLNSGTKLIADLGLTSVDFVSIFQKCQSLGSTRISFIELVMPVEGQYVPDLSIGELSDFILKQQSLRLPDESNTLSEVSSSSVKPQQTKYKRALFSNSQFQELQSLIQKPTFTSQQPIHTDYKLAFILSSPRSGSTLLQRMLDQHPEIESPEELHLLHFDSYSQRYSSLNEDSTKHLLGGTIRLRSKINNISLEQSRDVEDDLISSHQSILHFYDEINDRFEGKYLVDKTPSYTYSKETLERILKLFPDAKFIYLARHPSAVIKSLIDSQLSEIIPFTRRYGGDQSSIPEMLWSLCNSNIQSMLSSTSPSNVHYVNYEDLVLTPKETISSIINFLGLSFYEQCVDPYSENQDEIDTNQYAGDLKFFLENRIVNDRADKWRDFSELHALSPLTQDLLRNIAMTINS